MFLLLQVSFNGFEIIQGSSIGYGSYGMYFFTINLFLNVWRIFEKIFNNGIIY